MVLLVLVAGGQGTGGVGLHGLVVPEGTLGRVVSVEGVQVGGLLLVGHMAVEVTLYFEVFPVLLPHTGRHVRLLLVLHESRLGVVLGHLVSLLVLLFLQIPGKHIVVNYNMKVTGSWHII